MLRCYTFLLSCQMFEHINKDPCGSCTLTELYPLLVASTLHFGASPGTFDDCADRCSIDPNHELEAADVVALLNVLISTAAEKAQAARLRPRVTATKSAALSAAIGASPGMLTSATTSVAVAPCSTAQVPQQQQQQQHVTIAAPTVVPASSGSGTAASAKAVSRASMKAQAKQQAQQQRYLARAAKKATPTAETVTAYFEAKYDSQQQQQ
jgi:hypothetical protein